MQSSLNIADGDLVIRRMLDAEPEYRRMVEWRNRPHVRRWWDPDHPPLTIQTAVDEYRPDTRAGAVSTACIVELRGDPIGFMQFYRWSSYSDEARKVGIPFDDNTWGIDVFIGEAEEVGRGIGTRMVDLLCRYLETELQVTSIVLTTELDNHAAIRCYEKAGFAKGPKVLDTDTRDGERVMCWMMTRA